MRKYEYTPCDPTLWVKLEPKDEMAKLDIKNGYTDNDGLRHVTADSIINVV